MKIPAPRISSLLALTVTISSSGFAAPAPVKQHPASIIKKSVLTSSQRYWLAQQNWQQISTGMAGMDIQRQDVDPKGPKKALRVLRDVLEGSEAQKIPVSFVNSFYADAMAAKGMGRSTLAEDAASNADAAILTELHHAGLPLDGSLLFDTLSCSGFSTVKDVKKTFASVLAAKGNPNAIGSYGLSLLGATLTSDLDSKDKSEICDMLIANGSNPDRAALYGNNFPVPVFHKASSAEFKKNEAFSAGALAFIFKISQNDFPNLPFHISEQKKRIKTISPFGNDHPSTLSSANKPSVGHQL